MKLSANAELVLRRRYLQRDANGELNETPAGLFRRVARAVASAGAGRGQAPSEIDASARRFEARMASGEFLPNSPALMNAGRALGQLSACFVVPVLDSTEELFKAIGWAATIQKSGGGTGFSFSRVRPSGDRVQSTGGTASGPVSFMQIFDMATEAIKQGGTRRGANMGILRVDHPDILDFISIKLHPDRMKNFNLSVAVTDAFMAALASGGSYQLINPRGGAVVRELQATRVFDLLVNAAWATGDPGVVFLDRINAANPTPALGAIEATNPCGEQPLLPFESCTLGSINLGRFVDTEAGAIDWPRLRLAIRDGVDFLDLVVDANRYPLPEIAAATLATRKIGLGVMGFADALIELGIPYDDPRAESCAAEIASFLELESLRRSAELAAAHGPFPAYPDSRWQRGEWRPPEPIRNATTTTVAPTGTISIIADCSSGIEPLYGVAFERRVLDGEILAEAHPIFERLARERGFYSEELMAQVRARGTVRGIDVVPADIQALFATAHDVTPDAHLRIQAAFQKHVHAAVSKTINLPNHATPADVASAYVQAYKLGCKGVTVFRDGCRSEQVLSVSRLAPARPAGHACGECGAEIQSYDRCQVCLGCGWSACM